MTNLLNNQSNQNNKTQATKRNPFGIIWDVPQFERSAKYFTIRCFVMACKGFCRKQQQDQQQQRPVSSRLFGGCFETDR